MSISSFGQTGPNAAGAGHDLSIQAAAGMIDVPIGQEADLVLPVLPLADIASAMFAAIGVFTALFARGRSGRGASVDVSMFDSLASWMTPFLVPLANGLPTRILPPLDPGYGLFVTADKRQLTLSIAGEDHMWGALCRLLDLGQFESMAEQERNERAMEIGPPLRAAIARWTYDDLYRQLEAHGIAFGPVRRLDQVLTDPQLVARRMAVQVDGPNGLQTFMRQPLLIDGQVTEIQRQAPRLGQHNAELLGALATSGC